MSDKTLEQLEEELAKLKAKLNGDDESDEDEEQNEGDQDDDAHDDESDDNGDDDSQDDGKKQKTEKDSFKEKMDALDAKLKAAEKEAKEAKKKLREQELQALKDAGKHTEALEGKLADLEALIAEKDAELEAKDSEITTMKRDGVVEAQLAGLDFRNPKFKEFAKQEIVQGLVRDEDGNWVSKSGKDIESYVAGYFESEENSDLLKPKTNRGASTDQSTKKSDTTQKPESLFDIPGDKFFAQTKKKMGLR